MKTSRFFTAIGLITAVWFSACTNDEPMDPSALPEGKYPLGIASVTMSVESSSKPWGADAPQTRVTESENGNSSVWEWNGTERIGVQLYADGDDNVATYTLNADKTLTSDKTLYWKNKEQTTVMAWYPVETEVSLVNQKDKLAYVLKGSGTGTYQDEVTLSFTHQLAKVRVAFSDESTADLIDASVSILAPTICMVDKGNVTAGSNIEYIPMRKTTYDGKVRYEANVTPNLVLKDNAFQLVVDGKTVKCSTTEVKTQAGQLHIITLTVNEKYDEVNVSSISGTEYTVSGNVHLKGNGQNKELKLKVEEGSKLLLEDVILKPKATGHAVTCNGSATIKLLGKNEITGTCTGKYQEGSGILINKGTLTINGPGELKATGLGEASCGIGACNGASIIINGGIIIATSSNPYDVSWGNPGIGVSDGIGSGYCGDITINGGHITAQGGPYAAGIGTGVLATCGNITIQGENTIVTSKKGNGTANDIGTGDSGKCETITFRNGATVNGTKYN